MPALEGEEEIEFPGSPRDPRAKFYSKIDGTYYSKTPARAKKRGVPWVAETDTYTSGPVMVRGAVGSKR